MNIIEDQIKKIAGKDIRIVFPEGEDIRVLGAVARLKKDRILVPIVLGSKNIINCLAKQNNLDLDGVDIIDPKLDIKINDYIAEFIKCRLGKSDLEKASILFENVNYLGVMMTYLGEVDGMLSGAAHKTSDVIRPAFQIIKARPGVSQVSGAMIMVGPTDKICIFADIAVNISFDPNGLANVAIESAKTAELFDVKPKIAMLSFSTKGSSVSPESEKVVEATKIVKKIAPEIIIDGELQFDAAFIESVGKNKAPDSQVAGNANVFIFPDLQSGNIGYKIAQCMGGYKALGPILQGLNKPVNDLSRGCSEDDVYDMAIITAMQVLECQNNS